MRNGNEAMTSLPARQLSGNSRQLSEHFRQLPTAFRIFPDGGLGRGETANLQGSGGSTRRMRDGTTIVFSINILLLNNNNQIVMGIIALAPTTPKIHSRNGN